MRELGIDWEGPPSQWLTIPRESIPICHINGDVFSPSGEFLYKLVAEGELGHGTYGIVQAFWKEMEDERILVALKRPKNNETNLLLEALFQWKLHKDLREFHISFAVPEVYDIVIDERTGDVWFTMEAFNPMLLSYWCQRHLKEGEYMFGLLILQLALVLEVFENGCGINHRDLKVNNILVVEEEVQFEAEWEGKNIPLTFPFRVVFIDFGDACLDAVLDLCEEDGIPSLEPCVKEGRDIFFVLGSLWAIPELRKYLESAWGEWIREKLSIETITSRLIEVLGVKYVNELTKKKNFLAQDCAPWKIIQDCIEYACDLKDKQSSDE
jgi:serine/threonine protein kinase